MCAAPAGEATCSCPRAHGRVIPAQHLVSQGPPTTVVQEHMVAQGENSLNAGAQVRRRPTDGSISSAPVFEVNLRKRKEICIHNKQQQHQGFIPKIKKTPIMTFLVFLLGLALFLSSSHQFCSGIAGMCNFSTSTWRQDCFHV